MLTDMRVSRLAPVDPNGNLAAQIYDTLLAALVSGELAPGETYSVPELAKHFEVSATPVREAMLNLVNNGLLEPVKNKGFRVLTFTDEELDQIVYLRRLLEIPALVAAAELATPADIQHFRDLAHLCIRFAEEGNVIGYLETDRRLHLDILRLLKNERLIAIVDQLRAQTRLFGLNSLADMGQLKHSAQEHLTLIDALAANDAAQLRRLLDTHIGHARGIWSNQPE